MKSTSRILTCLLVSFALVEVPFSIHAHGGMIPTSAVISELTRDQNREKVTAFLSRHEVQKELVKFGVSADEASLRVASLSDSELQRMVSQIDQAPAGADVIVISLTTILLVIIILLLIGKI